MKRKDAESLSDKGIKAFLYHVARSEGIDLPTLQFARLEWLRPRFCR